jgi:hypothetical protein
MDRKSFVLGFFAAIILVLIWKFISGKVSFYDASSIFTPTMTPDQAKQAFDNEQQQINQKYNSLIDKANQTGGDSKGYLKQIISDSHDLSQAYNVWLIDNGPKLPPDGLPAPTPAPAPSS